MELGSDGRIQSYNNDVKMKMIMQSRGPYQKCSLDQYGMVKKIL